MAKKMVSAFTSGKMDLSTKAGTLRIAKRAMASLPAVTVKGLKASGCEVKEKGEAS